ncbi:beta strand repeat-containing protein [Salinispira pacifica]|uniref:Uncharacterized protein n=1 Tax=Salinispira pacifica TaxID=1307761 RepID=V5WLS9_9SPIO|nr:hypothetical protein [Salinispira pacifica]AHC16573.1 hypothetical protein L21SP2_3233 [Salinispira pacifica]
MLIALPAAVFAQKTWDGGGDNLTWNDALNWNGNTLPTPAENVDLSAAPVTVRLTGDGFANNLFGTAGTTIDLNGNTLTADAAAIIDGLLGPGTLSVTGVLDMSNAGADISGAITISAGSLSINNGRTLALTGAATFTTGGSINTNTDGTIDVSGSTGAVSIGGDVSGSGTVLLGGGSASIGGNVSVGTFTSGAGAVDINGDVTSAVSFTESSSTTNIAGASVDFSGGFTANTGELILDRVGSTTLTSNGNYNDFTVAGGTTVNLSNDATVGSAATVTGTLNTGANSFSAGSLSADGTVDAGGQTGTETFGVTGAVGGTGTVSLGGGAADIDGDVSVNSFTASSNGTAIGGSLTSATFTNGGSTVTFDTTGGNVGAVGGYTFNNVIVSAAVTAQSDWSAASLTANNTLDMNGNSLIVTGLVNGTGTVTLAAGTHDLQGNVSVSTLNGGAGTISVHGNLTSGTVALGSGAVDIDGDVTSAVSFTESSSTTNIAGTTVNFSGGFTANTGELILDRAGSTTLTSNGNYNDFTVAGPTNVQLQNNMTVDGLLTVNGTLTLGSYSLTLGGDADISGLDGGIGELQISGTVNLTSSGAEIYDLRILNGGGLTPQDALTVNRHFVIESGGSYGNNAQALTLGGIGGAAGDLTDSNGGTQDLGSVTVNTATQTMQSNILMSSLQIDSQLSTNGDTLDVDGLVDVNGTLDNSSGVVEVAGNADFSTGAYTNGGTIRFNGGGAQTLTTDGNNMGATDITGGATDVQMQDDANFGAITIPSGQLSTGNNTLDAASISADGTVDAGGQTVTETFGVTGAVGGTGTLSLGGGAADIDGDVSVNSFTASSNGTAIGGSLTSATFTNGGSTVTFDTTGGNVGAVGGYTFNNVIVSAAVTAQSDWSAASLTANNTLDMNGNSLIVTGLVNGTGTVTLAAGTHDLQGNVSVSTLNGGAGTISVHGNLTSGTVALGSGAVDIDGDVTSAVSFTESSSTTNIAGTTVNFSGGFTANTGELILDRAGSTTLTSNGNYHDFTVAGGTTVTLASDATVGSAATVTGTLNTGANSFSAGSLSADGTVDASSQTGTETFGVTGAVGGTGTVSLGGGAADIDGDVSVNSFTASSNGTAIGGSLTSATFTNGGSTVTFDTTGGNVGAVGGYTFNNVIVSAAVTAQSDWSAASLTANNTLDMNGNSLIVTGLVNGTGTVTLAAGTHDLQGNVSVSTLNGGAGTISVHGNLTSGTVALGSGAVDIDGDVTSAVSFTESSSTTNIAGTTVNFSGGFTANTGELILDRAGSTTLTSNGNYNDFTVAGGTTVTLASDATVGSAATVTGTLNTGANSFSAGSLSADGTVDASSQTGTETFGVTGAVGGTGTVSLGGGAADIDGDVSVNSFTASSNGTAIGGSLTSATFTNGGSTVTFDTTGGNVGAVGGYTFNNVIVSAAVTAQSDWSAASLTANNTLDMNGNSLIVTGLVNGTGTVTLAAGTHDLQGNVSVSTLNGGAGTISVHGNLTSGTVALGSGAVDIDGDVTSAVSFTESSSTTNIAGTTVNFSGGFTANTGELILDRAGSTTLTSNGNYNDFTVAGPTNVQLQNNMTVDGLLTVNGTLTLGSYSLTLGGDADISGLDGGIGELQISGTVNLTSSGAEIYDLRILNGGGLTPQDALTVNRHFVIESGGSYGNNAQALTLGGIGGAAGDLTDSNGGTQDLGSVTVNTATQTMQSNILMSSLQIDSQLSTNGDTLDVDGLVDVNGTLDNSSGVVEVAGNADFSTGAYTNGGTIRFNGGGAQTLTTDGNNMGATDITGGATDVQMQDDANFGAITIPSGQLSTGNNTLDAASISADGTVDAGGQTGTETFGVTGAVGGTGTLSLGGGGVLIGGNVSISTLNGGAGDVEITGDLTSGTATFGSGAVDINGATVNVGAFTESSATTSIASTTVNFSGGFTAAGGTVTFDSGAPTNLTSGGNYNVVEITPATTVNLLNGMTTNSNLVADGELHISTFNLNVGGNLSTEIDFDSTGGNVDVTGDFNHNNGTVSLQGTLDVTGNFVQDVGAGLFSASGDITFVAGSYTFNEDVEFNAGLTLISGGAVTVGSDNTDTFELLGGSVLLTDGAGTASLTINSQLNGPQNLTLRFDDITTIDGPVGNNTSLGAATGTNLTIDSAGTTSFNSTVDLAAGDAGSLNITGNGDVIFNSTLDAGEGLLQDDALTGSIEFHDEVTISGSTVDSNFQDDVELHGIIFNTAGDITFGTFNADPAAINDTLTISSGTVTINFNAANVTFTSNSNIVSATSEDLVIDDNGNASSQIVIEGNIGTDDPINDAGIYELGNLTFTADIIELSGGGIRTDGPGNNQFITGNETYVNVPVNIDIDSNGRPLIFNDLFIDSAGAVIELENIPAVSVNNFFLFGGTVDLRGDSVIPTDLYTDEDLVVLGYAANTSVDDPDRAAGADKWKYPSAINMPRIETYQPAPPYTGGFGDLDGVNIRVDNQGDNTYGPSDNFGNFYVNSSDLPSAGGDWNLYLPDNRSAAPTPGDNTDWGAPYSVSINNTITNALVQTKTIIAANIVTDADANPSTLNGSTSVYDFSAFTQPDFNPDTRGFSGDFSGAGAGRVRFDSEYTPNYGFDNVITVVDSIELVKDDVARITFNKPIMNTNSEITSSAASINIGGTPFQGEVYLAPYWAAGNQSFPLYSEIIDDDSDGNRDTEPYRRTDNASFDALKTIYLKLNGATWATDSNGTDAGGAGTGTDSEGNVPGIGAVDIGWLKAELRGSNGADMVYADNDGGGYGSGDADLNVNESAEDKMGPVLYAVEVGRMRNSGDGRDGHNFFKLHFSEDITLSSQLPGAVIGAGNYRADTTFDGAVTIGGDFLNDQIDIDSDSTDEEVVHLNGYFFYTNSSYALGTDPPFQTGYRDVPAAGKETVNSLYALDDRTIEVYLAGFWDGTNWPGWHFLVPDPYSPGTLIEVEQNNFITDSSASDNWIDALESTRSLMESPETVQRPDAYPVGSSFAATDTPFTPLGSTGLPGSVYTPGTNFDFWDVSAPVISAFQAGADPANLYPGLRPNIAQAYEIVLIENPITQLIDGFDVFIQDNGIASAGAFQLSEDNLAELGNWVASSDHDEGAPGGPLFSDRPYYGTAGIGDQLDEQAGETYRGVRDSSATFAGNFTTFTESIRLGVRGETLSSAFNAGTELGGEYQTDSVENQLYRRDGSIIAGVDDPYFRLFINNAATAGWDNLTEIYLAYAHNQNGYLTDLAGNLMPSSRPENMASQFGPEYEPYAINPFEESGVAVSPEKGKLLAIERTPPEIILSLAAVSGNRIYVKFTEPVWADQTLSSAIDETFFVLSDPGVNITGIEVLKSNAELSPSNTPGVEEAYLLLDSELSADDLFLIDIRPVDQDPGPSTETFYDKALNQYRIGSNRRITDVGIGIVRPIWATDGIQKDDERGSGFSSIRDFDGSEALDDLDITVESGITAPSYHDLPINLFFDVNVPDDKKNLLLDGAPGMYWSPIAVPGLIPDPNTEARISNRQNSDSSTGIAQHLLPAGDPEIERGAEVEFMYRVGPLLAANIEDPNEPLTLKPWSIEIGGIVEQRGGATILNNVINPETGDQTVLNYTLDRPGMVLINVFTLDGDLVKVLHRGRQGTGIHNISWNGQNSNGDTVARGFYFIRITAPGVDEIRKVLVVK